MNVRRTLPVILAAGMASRLDGIAKPLLPVGGTTLLDHCLDALSMQAFERVLLVTGHRADDLLRHLSRRVGLEVDVAHNGSYDLLNNFHSVRVAVEAAGEEDLLIINGDVIFEPELVPVAGVAAADVTLLVDRTGADEEAMKVEISAGRVQRLGKHIPASRTGGEFIGISVLGASATRRYRALADAARRAGERHLYYEDIYSRMCDEVEVRAAFVEPGTWAEIDSPADLPRAEVVAARRETVRGGQP